MDADSADADANAEEAAETRFTNAKRDLADAETRLRNARKELAGAKRKKNKDDITECTEDVKECKQLVSTARKILIIAQEALLTSCKFWVSSFMEEHNSLRQNNNL